MGWQNSNYTLIVVSAGTAYSGVFVYSPSPGAGKLVASIAASDGTDPYGNSYLQGIEIINGSKAILLNQAGAAGGIPSMQFFSGAAEETGQAAIFEQILDAGPSEVIDLEIFSAFNSQTSHVGMGFHSAAADGSILGTILFDYIDTAGSEHVYMALQANGMACSMQRMYSVEPGTNDTTTVNETWHTVPLNAGFTGGATLPRYQFEALNGGRVRLSGVVNVTANHAPGTVFATLPAGYIPAKEFYFLTANSVDPGATSTQLQADASGNLIVTNASVNGDAIGLDGVVYELD